MPAESRYAPDVARLREAVLSGPGETDPALRRAVAARAGELARGEAVTEIPSELVPYLDKVALHAYKVLDRDVDVLEAAGWSQEQLFELTVAVAVGSALVRVESGVAALGRSL